MRRSTLLLLLAQAALVAGLVFALRSGRLPLGVPGEWEWSRLRFAPTALDWSIALTGVGLFVTVVGLGGRALARDVGRGRETAWVVLLGAAGVAAQVLVQSGAAEGFGLTKWVTLGLSGSSGYHTVARAEAHDPWRFWADYPGWIEHQDALHIGTHPPGLFLWARAIHSAMEASPVVARGVVDSLPASVALGFRQILGPWPLAERAALATTGLLTLLACAATVGPLYALARWSGRPPSEAWAAAALWPLLPSAILFQPTADTAFPVLATLALALATRGRWWSHVAAGLALGVGMVFTLAFLPVGLVVALVLVTKGERPWWGRLADVGCVGLGFLAVTLACWAVSGANPFVIWWWNQKNHARFYEEYPRSYFAWVFANPIELAVALGLPTVVAAAIGLRRAPRAAWVTVVVLIVLNFSGRNLSEIARLWLPLMPPLLLAAAAALSGRGAATTAATVALVGLQTVVLQATIQVVYPTT